MQLKWALECFLADDDGATAVEYGLMALIMGLGIVASLQTLPPALQTIWTAISSNVSVN